MIFTCQFYIERADKDIELDCEFEIEPPIRGNWSGPPDTWLPSEGGFAQLTKAFYHNEDWLFALSPAELDRLELEGYRAWEEEYAR